jgi:hypothetical protein
MLPYFKRIRDGVEALPRNWVGLDHGIGHVASISPEKNEQLTSSKD